MIFTKMTDYALRIVLELSKRGRGITVTMDEIASSQKIPKSFIPKIVSELQRKGILKTERGRKGGVTLIKNPEEISMFDVISSFENMDYFSCTSTPFICEFSERCPMHRVFKRASAIMEEYFRKVTFGTLTSKRVS